LIQVILPKGLAKGMLVMMMSTSSVDGLVLAPLPVLATIIARDEHGHWLISALHLTQVVAHVAQAAALAFKSIGSHRDLTKGVAVQLFGLSRVLQYDSQVGASEKSADAKHGVRMSLNSSRHTRFCRDFLDSMSSGCMTGTLSGGTSPRNKPSTKSRSSGSLGWLSAKLQN